MKFWKPLNYFKKEQTIDFDWQYLTLVTVSFFKKHLFLPNQLSLYDS